MSNPNYPWLTEISAELIERIGRQQLHHGLLFIADKGVGQAQLINKLAKALVCSKLNACNNCKACKLFTAHSHPDIKRVISDKPSIGVDLIRAVSEFVTSTSQLLGNKVVIIEEIERMTEAAGNSLLKTLEEPNNNTYILLSTTQPNAILATIKSRCEKIRLSLPSKEVSLHWLREQTSTAVDEQGLKAFSGSPIDYLFSLSQSGNGYNEFMQDLSALEKKQITGISIAEKWQKQAPTVLQWIYLYAVNRFEQAMLNNEPRTVIEGLIPFINVCETANIKINQAGINKSLLLQQVFTHIKH